MLGKVMTEGIKKHLPEPMFTYHKLGLMSLNFYSKSHILYSYFKGPVS